MVDAFWDVCGIIILFNFCGVEYMCQVCQICTVCYFW